MMDMTPDIVDAVLYFLATLSLLVWTIVFAKMAMFYRYSKANRALHAALPQVVELAHLERLRGTAQGPLGRLAQAALAETGALGKLRTLSRETRGEMVLHAMRKQAHTEQTRMESGLGVLASVGSTAPFIGLFGTVWGIMQALKNISASGSAGLDVVAGPIGEALIATAIGIATAVPAVLAYNYYVRKMKLAVADMEHFAGTLLHLLVKTGAHGE